VSKNDLVWELTVRRIATCPAVLVKNADRAETEYPIKQDSLNGF